jgi:hypothetical protein
MDLYLIVGNPKTRKSSLVRSLSGCFNRSVRDIALVSGREPLKLFARAGSLQETKTRPEDLVIEVEAVRCNAVLCCVSPNAHLASPTLYPSAAAYFDYFVAQGWRVRGIAALGQNNGGLRSAALKQYPQSGVVPINVTASAVRMHFGWQ